MTETTDETRRPVSIKEACSIASVSRRTIYNWLNSGKLEYTRTAGGAVRIYADTLWSDPDVKRLSPNLGRQG